MLKNNKNYITFETLKKDLVTNVYTKKCYDFISIKSNPVQNNPQLLDLKKDLNLAFENVAFCQQCHSSNVACVTKNNYNEVFDNTDGLITDLPHLALTSVSADCQSIFLYDSHKKVIGNIHSGWQGTLKKIIINAVSLMHSNYGCNFSDIQVCICPSILKCCFEVDEDVKELFVNNFNEIDINSCISLGSVVNNKQKYFIDTVRVNVFSLLNLGVLDEHIYQSNICTKCNSDLFHSYRKDLDNSGRNLALIYMN